MNGLASWKLSLSTAMSPLGFLSSPAMGWKDWLLIALHLLFWMMLFYQVALLMAGLWARGVQSGYRTHNDRSGYRGRRGAVTPSQLFKLRRVYLRSFIWRIRVANPYVWDQPYRKVTTGNDPGDSIADDGYPPVTVLIPAFNEGKVLAETLRAMVRLEYPGPLEVWVLDDGSTDDTAAIAQDFAALFRRIVYVPVPPPREGEPKTKARVLNYALKHVVTPFVAIYDADNQPEPSALRVLVETLMREPQAAGVAGYVRTLNSHRNLLTRMIALEFSVFQLMMQLGRWTLLRVGTLPGTNMLLRVDVLRKLGGWDTRSLAEDLDLTVRLAGAGWRVAVAPASQSWEQEPETLAVWWRQRRRWMLGNVETTLLLLAGRITWRRGAWLHGLHSVSAYAVLLGAVTLSDVILVAGLLGRWQADVSFPLLSLWVQAYLVYVLQIQTAASVDGLWDARDLLISIIMYVTYAQLWIVLAWWVWTERFWRSVRGLLFRANGPAADLPVWDKTVRF